MTQDHDPAATPPLPDPDPLTQFYWDGANAHKLMILRCQDCGHYIHYPRPVCNRCLSENLAPEQVSGRGTLYTYTIPMQPIHPYFIARVPYINALIELVEEANLKIVANLVDCSEEDLRVGMPLEVVFEEVAPGVTLPQFRPVEEGV